MFHVKHRPFSFVALGLVDGCSEFCSDGHRESMCVGGGPFDRLRERHQT